MISSVEMESERDIRGQCLSTGRDGVLHIVLPVEAEQP
jgi:hypothetical protein